MNYITDELLLKNQVERFFITFLALDCLKFKPSIIEAQWMLTGYKIINLFPVHELIARLKSKISITNHKKSFF